MSKKILCYACLALFLIGCGGRSPMGDDVVIQKVDKEDIREIMQESKMAPGFEERPEALFAAIGEGIPPVDTVSPAQARALAKRAAVADAQRQLAGKLFGVKINAHDTVKDAMLKSSLIDSRVNGLIKNAAIVNQDFKDGLYRVEMELKMDADKWQEIFAY